jgi:hypothetical protein
VGAAAAATAVDAIATEIRIRSAAPMQTMPSRAQWYVGQMNRKKCERLVKGSMPGDFLVRRSASSETEILCVNDYGEAANFPIAYVVGPKPVVYSRKHFLTVDDAIAHALARPLKSRLDKSLKLMHPANVDGWYDGEITREKCEKFVNRGEAGDFIVRKSSSGDSYTVCINEGGKKVSQMSSKACVSFSIRIHGREQFVFRKRIFTSLESAIDDLRRKPLTGKRGQVYQALGPPDAFLTAGL